MSKLLKGIGLQLKDLRLASGKTQEELGAQVGLSHISIARIEAGVQNAPLSTLDRLAAPFGRRVVVTFEPVRDTDNG